MTSADELEELLDSFEEQLSLEDVARAQRALSQLRACSAADAVVLAYAHARLVWLESGPEAAVPWLEKLVEQEPEHSEALYDLGCIAGDLGDHDEQVRYFLRVRALDVRVDRDLDIGNEAELTHIEQVARSVLDGLPELFSSRLGHVPVLIEPRPSHALVAEGFDPRAFGLFEGPPDGVLDVPAPTRIVLYAANLLAEFPDPEELDEQIEVTVLHEVGHFFNLDEEQLAKLGLD